MFSAELERLYTSLILANLGVGGYLYSGPWIPGPTEVLALESADSDMSLLADVNISVRTPMRWS